jgi:hypothetical protein
MLAIVLFPARLKTGIAGEDRRRIKPPLDATFSLRRGWSQPFLKKWRAPDECCWLVDTPREHGGLERRGGLAVGRQERRELSGVQAARQRGVEMGGGVSYRQLVGRTGDD